MKKPIAIAALLLLAATTTGCISRASLPTPYQPPAQTLAAPEATADAPAAEPAAEPYVASSEPLTPEEAEEVSNPEPAQPAAPVLSLSQQNALGEAASYLDYSGFSRMGLIDQLLYEEYSEADAVFAVDNVEVDWNQEAAESAQSYLDYSTFSRQGLYDQLAYEEFTPEQIEFALAAVGY